MNPKFYIRLNSLFFFSLSILFTLGLSAQTFTTIQNGDWHQASTWQGGNVPDITSSSGNNQIDAGWTVNVYHEVFIDKSQTTSDLFNYGTLNIEQHSSTTDRAILRFDDGVNFTNESTGILNITDALFYQCRFSSCMNEDYDNLGGVIKHSGSWMNKGGEVNCTNSYMEVPQAWQTDGGTRTFVNCCVSTGQDYQITKSIDSYTGCSISVGWHQSGNFQVSDSDVSFNGTSVQLAGESGNFEFNSGSVSGDIPYISFKNQVRDVIGSGKIATSSSVSGTVDLGEYCCNDFENSGNKLVNGTDDDTGGNPSCPDNDTHFPGETAASAPIKACEGPVEFSAFLNSTLPVDFIAVEASIIKSGVLLEWSTANEIDNNYFEILKSDGSDAFIPIGYVEGAGNSSEIRQYTFVDDNPIEGVNYYQVKQVDYNELYSFSDVVMVEFIPDLTTFSILPNPANDYIDVKMSGNKEGQTYDLMFIDLSGRIIKSTPIINNKRIDISDIPTGVINAQFINQTSGITFNKRILVTR